MLKRIIKKTISLIVAIAALVSAINLWLDHRQDVERYEAFYEKRHLTAEDMKMESSWKSCTTIGGTPPEEVSYRKLYGIEYIGEYEIDKDGGINVISATGEPVKVLILDEKGKEIFYRAISTLYFEPGEAGEYGKLVTYNKGTEFEETFYAYYVPAGTYTVTNKGEYMSQINVYSDETVINEDGWEEPKSTGTVKLLDVDKSETITIENGQHIEIAEPSVFELKQQ